MRFLQPKLFLSLTDLRPCHTCLDDFLQIQMVRVVLLLFQNNFLYFMEERVVDEPGMLGERVVEESSIS